MADVIDKANDLAEMERNQAIRDALREKGPHYTGMCWNCSEPLDRGAYCDRPCEDDFNARRRMRG